MKLSRRTLLKSSVAGGALLYVGCGNDVGVPPLVHAAVGANGTVRLDLSRVPELGPIGSAVRVDLGLPDDTPYQKVRDGLLVIHRADDSDPPAYVASQLSCPHLGCPLGYSASDLLIECPCHASRFLPIADPDVMGSCAGDVMHPPATQGLTMYAADYLPSTNVLQIDLTNALTCGGTTIPSPVGGKITMRTIEFPDLAMVGGTMIGQPPGLADTLIIIRVDDTTVDTLSAICTHRACDVSYLPGPKKLYCPCHSSVFALTGSVLQGPAVLPLTVYPTTFDGTTIVITTG